MPRKKEIEVKISVNSFDEIRRRLRGTRATLVGSGPESNFYYERSKGKKLSADKRVLRFRNWQNKNYLTYKRSLEDSDNISSRDEAETEVGNFHDMGSILGGIGFYPHLSYIKDREVWFLRGTAVSLDEIEGGRMFVEVELREGYSRRELLWVVSFLGLAWSLVEKRSYPEIIKELRGEK